MEGPLEGRCPDSVKYCCARMKFPGDVQLPCPRPVDWTLGPKPCAAPPVGSYATLLWQSPKFCSQMGA
jgi:hypothetical protein